MTQNILLISGKKQSGKTSLSNFIHGYVMQRVSCCIEGFRLDDYGNLVVPASFTDSQGNTVNKSGIISLDDRSPEFISFARANIWPYVKAYSFADMLKHIAISVFGLTKAQCFGADEDKNTFTEVKWSDISFALPPRTVGELKKTGKFNDFMTCREFLQEFGTNICRKIRPNCWAKGCFERIQDEGSQLAIVGDCRFPDELGIGHDCGAKSVRYLRDVYKDKHKSETALDKEKGFSFVLDNSELTLVEQNNTVLQKLIEWEFVPPELATL